MSYGKKRDFDIKIDELLIQRGIHPTQNKKNLLKIFNNTFHDSAWSNHCDSVDEGINDGWKMIEILSDETKLGKLWSNNGVYNLMDVIPELSNNYTAKNIFPKLCRVSDKGTGVGEVLWRLLFNTEDTSKDVLCEELFGELKKWDGGCVKSIEDKEFKNISDKAIKEYFDGLDISTKSNTKVLKRKIEDWWESTPNVEDRVRGFVETVYPMLDDENVTKWVNIIIDNKFDRTKMNNLIGFEILKMYIKIDGFDFLCMVDEETLDVVYINDFSDVDWIMENVHFKVMFKRGADKNALSDGYTKIFGGKSKT
tara:strand:- start:584 stop:1513 length:930 start_codon:yes stop_codon:yes gene_type:complete